MCDPPSARRQEGANVLSQVHSPGQIPGRAGAAGRAAGRHDALQPSSADTRLAPMLELPRGDVHCLRALDPDRARKTENVLSIVRLSSRSHQSAEAQRENAALLAEADGSKETSQQLEARSIKPLVSLRGLPIQTSRTPGERFAPIYFASANHCQRCASNEVSVSTTSARHCGQGGCHTRKNAPRRPTP